MKAFLPFLLAVSIPLCAMAQISPDDMPADEKVVSENAGKAPGFFVTARTGKKYHFMTWWEALIVTSVTVSVFHIAIARNKRRLENKTCKN